MGVGEGAAIAGHGGKEMDDGGCIEKAVNVPAVVGKGIVERMPHGIPCMFDQGFCCAPAGVEFLWLAAPCPESLELVRVHEPRGKTFKVARAYALDIDADGMLMECQAQAIAGVAEIEWQCCAFRFSMWPVGDGNFIRGQGTPARQLLPQQGADEGVSGAPGACLLTFIGREQGSIGRSIGQRGQVVDEVIHSDADESDLVCFGVVDSDAGGILPPVYFSRISQQGVAGLVYFRCVGVTVENGVVLPGAGCLGSRPWEMTEEDAAGIQHDVRLSPMQRGLRALLCHAGKCSGFVFIVAKNEVDGVRPFFTQGAERGDLCHVAHVEQVGAPLLLRAVQRQQQVGGMVVDV